MQQSETQERSSRPEELFLRGCRILVVEDDYFQAEDTARALRHLGANVIGPVADVGDALEIITAGDAIDAAILDINLHDDTSYPIANALRQSEIPFLFATGYGESAIPVEYRNVVRWQKPFDHIALARAVRALLPESAAGSVSRT